MQKNINVYSRLEKLEKKLKGEPVYIIVEDERTNEETEMLFSEWAQDYPQNGLAFCRFSRGYDPTCKDVDFILKIIADEAFKL